MTNWANQSWAILVRQLGGSQIVCVCVLTYTLLDAHTIARLLTHGHFNPDPFLPWQMGHPLC